MKPLVFIPSPRDIHEFLECADKIKLDKYWVKYYRPEILAYQELRRFFLERIEYTHLIILPDDLIVSANDVNTLIGHVTKNPELQIVSGFCNIDTTDLKDYANICIELVSDKRPRDYYWKTFSEFDKYCQENKNEQGLIKAKFSGFPLMIIARQVIENIEFRNDSMSGISEDGCCIDVTFCYDAHLKGYDIYVDPSLRLYHMKIADGRYQNMIRDQKPYTKLELMAVI